MRALAEASGDLGEVSKRSLPPRVFAGGMRAVVERRLRRVPEAARAMLQLAAVGGRQLDLAVLRVEVPDVERWLVPCAESAVLEVTDQRWQFAHDKLRERLLEDLDTAERRDLHARIARAIESVYADRTALAAALAYHYRAAAAPAQAAHYDLHAGELALKNGALQVAVTHLQQALAYFDAEGGDSLLRVRLRRRLSEASYAMGRVEDCIAHFLPGRALLGFPYPEAPLPRLLATAVEAGVQLGHALWPSGRRGGRLGQQELLELVGLNRAAQEAFIWHGQDSDALLCGLGALNAAEDSGNVNEDLIICYAFVAYLLCILGLQRAARYYLDKAADRLRRYQEPAARYQLLRAHAPILVMWRQWDEARAATGEAVALARSLGDVGKELFCLLQAVSANLYAGQHRAARAGAAELMVRAQLAGNVQYTGWAACMTGLGMLRCDEDNSAQALLVRAYEIASQTRDTLGEIFNAGLLATAALHRDDWSEAARWAEQTLRLVERTPLTGHALLEGYAGPIEVYLRIMEMERERGRRSSVSQGVARKALGVLTGYAARIPLGRARALLWAGRWALLHGHRERARKLWERCAAEAQAASMPYEVALATASIATARLCTGAAASALLQRAAALLGELGLTPGAVQRTLAALPR
jgi:hypothetical protein